MNKKTLRGGCLCGDVKITATPDDEHITACHCTMCRRWTGGVNISIGCGNNVHVEGESLGVYKSSQWAERLFC